LQTQTIRTSKVVQFALTKEIFEIYLENLITEGLIIIKSEQTIHTLQINSHQLRPTGNLILGINKFAL